MTLELASFFIGGITTLISAYLAYSAETIRKRRLLILTTLALAGVAGLCGWEAYVRKTSTETLAQEVEREWLILQDTPVLAVEVEALAPDGILDPGIVELAKGVRFNISGVALNPASDHSPPGEIDFAKVLSAKNLLNGARLGYPLADISYRENDGERTIEKVKQINCISSQSTSAQLRKDGAPERLSGLCSAAVRFPPAAHDVRLKALATSSRVAMTITLPEKARCLGRCDPPAMFSVKAILQHGEQQWPTMIELSPSLMRNFPTSSSEATHTTTFEMSGKSLMELAKSHYLQTFGHRERDHFAFTKGLVTEIMMKLFTRAATLKLVDVVWTTDPNTSEEHLANAIPSEWRSRVEVFNGQEWCGFGDLMKKERKDGQLCWYRFFMMAPAP